jgi:Flp pilus assembly CpaF family ATPase
MNDLMIIYQKEIFEEFKNRFKHNLIKNVPLVFQELMNETLYIFDIKEFKETDLFLFKNWFEHVYHQKFIIDTIILQNFDEIIFHSESFFQLKNQETKEIFQIDILSAEDYQISLEILVNKMHLTWNFTECFISFNKTINQVNYRFTLIHQALAENNRSKLFIRKHRHNQLSLDSFFQNEDALKISTELIKNKSNILIVGSTGSGKTTLLNNLLSLSSEDEHTVILEDTHEIKIDRKSVTNLIARDGVQGKSLKDYCSYAMRMSPDRIILGEMRSNEVVPFLLAMNSGHRGLISTIHANSALDSISRLALLFSIYSNQIELNTEYIIQLICKSLDYVIFIENKKVKEIVKVLGAEKNVPFLESIYLNAA